MLPTVRRTLDHPFAMLREFDRALGGAMSDAPSVGDSFAVDIFERADTLMVEAELPGYTRDQVSVNVEQGVLTIEASRSDRAESGDDAPKGVRRHLTERTEQVTRRFSLPSSYDTNRVDAKLEHGVLTLSLPKREEVKPKAIEVK